MKIQNTIRHYEGEHGALDRLEHSLKVLYKKDYRGMKFFMPPGASEKQIEKIENVLSKIENSPYFTKQGRIDLKEQIKESFRNNPIHDYMSDEQADRLFDLFQNGVWSKIREMLYGFESEIAIDTIIDLMEDGKENDEILKILEDFINSTDSNKELRSFVDNFKENM